MPTIQLHIQGLTHYDIAERREQFLETAVGRRVALRPACLCEDRRAVEAFVGGECVGVVSRLDLDLTWAAIRGTAKRMLHGRIVSAQAYSLLVEVQAKELLWGDAAASGLEDWTYSGPVLPVRADERKLAFLEEELTTILADNDGLADEDAEDVLELLEAYCRTAPYDISGEGLLFRSKLVQWLTADPRLQEAADQVRKMSQQMGGAHWMQQLGEWMKTELPTSREALVLTIEPAALTTVQSEAERLPSGMLGLWRKDTTQFARVLYGLNASRVDLRRVLSCMVLLELTGARDKDEDARVDDFVKKIVDETKHLYKHDRKKADEIRQIMIKLGRTDADEELDAWIEGRAYQPPPMNVAGDYVVTKYIDNEVNGVASGGIGIDVNKGKQHNE